MHSQSFIENLGLHGPQVAQKIADRGAVSRQPSDVSQVGEGRHSNGMTDDEREDAIYRAGVAMEVWYARFKASQDQADLDLAYHYLGIQKTLLAGRSAEYVAKLEQERGLA